MCVLHRYFSADGALYTRLLAGDEESGRLRDLMALNRALGEDERTVHFYDTLASEESTPATIQLREFVRRIMSEKVVEILFRSGR